ncbi:RING finger protein 10 [Schistocerca serialis cubense]|uniref:RING finger protein 10 n=1 Tax=Schistocerca serialis cubense TaxID=2023355 RepID=UPI00214EC519|nr:RING finger protein 10 [Schistocerca serialis cubense]
MLEDFTMDKKSTRSVQPPVKGNGTEAKKNQDVSSNKQFQKTVRRREQATSSNTRYETSRKPAPQKCKSIDKRPKPRGQYYSGGKEDTKVAGDESIAEYGSVVLHSSKKQNLNHLLNFHYAPREGTTSWRSGWGSSGSGRHHHVSLRHKYNKEQFLQANCQFVVRADADYSAYISDPDALVSWDLIEQIRLQSCEMVSCPICLYPPVAAKMTRCGHVYCWPCILHYLALSDKSWSKCPICYESVHRQDLKSVIAIPHTQFSVGEEITLRLMKREKGSLLPVPVDQCKDLPMKKLLSVSEKELDTTYSKLLLATPAEVLSIIERERCELEVQLADDESQPETCFIQQAIDLLSQRKIPTICEDNKLLELGAAALLPETLSTVEPAHPDLQVHIADVEIKLPVAVAAAATAVEAVEDIAARKRCESFCSEESESANITVENLESPSTQASQKYFYFYQAADGQHIYMHALNVRMLEHIFGSLENCPPTVRGRIIEKEPGSVTEELRHRLRYLQHLPITSQFDVVELHILAPTIPRRTLEFFHDQLEVRRKRRRRKAQDERKREKRITEEENKRWGRYPTPNIRIESQHQFPQCGTDVDGIRVDSPISPAESSLASSPSLSQEDNLPSVVETLSLENVDSTGPSFAQMLREGKSRPPSVWPRVSVASSVSPRAPTQHTGARHSSDSETELEGYVPVPTFQQSFSDAIALALEKAATAHQNNEGNIQPSSGKKKKKMKQKVLFATGMACSSK